MTDKERAIERSLVTNYQKQAFLKFNINSTIFEQIKKFDHFDNENFPEHEVKNKYWLA
jgi:hypothetical protein